MRVSGRKVERGGGRGLCRVDEKRWLIPVKWNRRVLGVWKWYVFLCTNFVEKIPHSILKVCKFRQVERHIHTNQTAFSSS